MKNKPSRDPWLDEVRERKAVAKAAKQVLKETGRVEASASIDGFGLMNRAKGGRIINWGRSKKGSDAQVTFVSKAGNAPEPPESKQLRDPFTTFYVQGIALEPPLPPDRLLNLTEENPLHAACLIAKAVDACGRGWYFQPKDDVVAELQEASRQAKKLPFEQEKPGQPAPGMPDEPQEPPQADEQDDPYAQAPGAGLRGAQTPPLPAQPGMPAQPGQPAAPKPPDPVEDLMHSPLPRKLKQRIKDITPTLSFTELLVQAVWEMEAIGWSIWEVVRKNNDGTPGKHGDIAALYTIPAHTMRASLDPRKWVQIRAGRVRYFKTFGANCTINNETGEIYEWDAKKGSKGADAIPEEYISSEIIIFKNYTPRSLWYGLPKWVSCVATIAELNAIREFNVSWFASGGQADYHMHFTADSVEKAQTMKDQVEQQQREWAGRGHTNLFTAGDADSGVQVSKLGDILREGHFRFRRGDLVKEVVIAHQVPPYRIGWAETGSLGGNAAPEMLKAYQVGAIIPLQQIIEEMLAKTLFDPKKGINTGDFEFKLNDLTLESEDSELKLATQGVESGFMTPNQARDYTGQEPVKNRPELDEYYYKGQKLGTPPPSPFGAPPGHPGAGGPPKPPNPFGQDGGPPKPPNPFGQQPKEEDQQQGPQFQKTAIEEVARGVVLGILRDYEARTKAALVDNDPIDSEQPPSKKPRRGRGIPNAVSGAGPARDDKPQIA